MKGRAVTLGIVFVSVLLILGSLSTGVEGSDQHGVLGGYKHHDPIRIVGNDQFDFEHGVVGGSGTKDDPYIISGWEIDGQGSDDAIYISSTTAYFVIENCYIHNAEVGIYLINVKHGHIMQNRIRDNDDGIYISISDNDTVDGNVIEGNTDGVYLDGSRFIEVADNHILNNTKGVFLDGGRYNEVGGNLFENNTYGMFLDGSVRNEVVGNDFENCTYGTFFREANYNQVSRNRIENGSYGIYIFWSHYDWVYGNHIADNGYAIYLKVAGYNKIGGNEMLRNSIFLSGAREDFRDLEIYANNTVNSKPVYFYSDGNLDNATVPKDAGEVICWNVEWLRMEGLELLNGSVGIELGFSSNVEILNSRIGNQIYGIYLHESEEVTVTENRITGNEYGIYLDWSSNNDIAWNRLENNTNYAIYLSFYSNDNVIYGNSFFYNRGSGDTYDPSHVQAYDDGTDNSWDAGGRGNYWHDWANNNETNDQNNDGIVDWPYAIDGSARAKDRFPLKSPSSGPPVPEIPMTGLAIIIALLSVWLLFRKNRKSS